MDFDFGEGTVIESEELKNERKDVKTALTDEESKGKNIDITLTAKQIEEAKLDAKLKKLEGNKGE